MRINTPESHAVCRSGEQWAWTAQKCALSLSLTVSDTFYMLPNLTAILRKVALPFLSRSSSKAACRFRASR